MYRKIRSGSGYYLLIALLFGTLLNILILLNPDDKQRMWKIIWNESRNSYRPSYLMNDLVDVKYKIKSGDMAIYRDRIYELVLPFGFVKPMLGNIVHFDFSRDPIRLNFLRKVFKHIAYFGAKSIMLQYDDTFPYSGYLTTIKSPHAYTTTEISTLLSYAMESKLEIIVYVKVLGSMEYLLQHSDFSNLGIKNEFTTDCPRVICPCNRQSITVIKEIIDQVMSLHKIAKAIHIGGHDFYNSRPIVSNCNCSQNQHETYITYMRSFLTYIKKQYPSVIAIMWDNRLRKMSVAELTKFQGLVEPMILAFHPDVHFMLNSPFWKNYKGIFQRLWFAGAYKGAENCDQNYVVVANRLSNFITWIKNIRHVKRTVAEVGGLALMGFSRISYTQPTCQLLPAALPSLMVSLFALGHGEYHMYTNSEVAVCTLRCIDNFPVELREDYTVEDCERIPARRTYRLLSILQLLRNRFGNFLNALRADPQIFNQKLYNQLAIDEITYLKRSIHSLEKEITSALQKVYHYHSIDDWLQNYVIPIRNAIDDLHWHFNASASEKENETIPT